MNNTFNLSRFLGLLKDFIIRKLLVLVLIAVIFSVLILAIFFKMDGMPSSYLVAREPAFIFSIMLFSWISIHYVKDKIFSKEIKLRYLLIPNSTFEKWIFDILFIVILPIIFITCIFSIVDVIALEYIVKPKIMYSSISVEPFKALGFDKSLLYNGIGILLIFCLWLLITLLHGGLLKRLIIGGTIIGAFVGFNILLNAMFFGINSSTSTLLHMPLSNISMENKHFQHDSYVFNSGFTDAEIYLYAYLPFTILLAVVYYFKLKELEV